MLWRNSFPLTSTVTRFVFTGTLELQNNILSGTVPSSLAVLGRLSEYSSMPLSLCFFSAPSHLLISPISRHHPHWQQWNHRRSAPGGVRIFLIHDAAVLCRLSQWNKLRLLFSLLPGWRMHLCTCWYGLGILMLSKVKLSVPNRGEQTLRAAQSYGLCFSTSPWHGDFCWLCL